MRHRYGDARRRSRIDSRDGDPVRRSTRTGRSMKRRGRSSRRSLFAGSRPDRTRGGRRRPAGRRPHRAEAAAGSSRGTRPSDADGRDAAVRPRLARSTRRRRPPLQAQKAGGRRRPRSWLRPPRRPTRCGPARGEKARVKVDRRRRRPRRDGRRDGLVGPRREGGDASGRGPDRGGRLHAAEERRQSRRSRERSTITAPLPP